MQDIKFERGVWAVIYLSGGKKLIGQAHAPMKLENEDDTEGEKIAILAAAAENIPLEISPAFEFITAAMPYVDPNTGSEGMKRFVQVMPIDNCINPGTVHTAVEGFHFFNEMEKDDAIAHKELIDSVMRRLIEVRAKKAGIETASSVPPKFGGGAKFG